MNRSVTHVIIFVTVALASLSADALSQRTRPVDAQLSGPAAMREKERPAVRRQPAPIRISIAKIDLTNYLKVRALVHNMSQADLKGGTNAECSFWCGNTSQSSAGKGDLRLVAEVGFINAKDPTWFSAYKPKGPSVMGHALPVPVRPIRSQGAIPEPGLKPGEQRWATLDFSGFGEELESLRVNFHKLTEGFPADVRSSLKLGIRVSPTALVNGKIYDLSPVIMEADVRFYIKLF